jgi:hypothetical protein
MALYTFVLEYDGGTYIAQVRSQSPKSAIKKWLNHIAKDSTMGLSPNIKKSLTDNFITDTPTPITGISKTWCISASVRGKLALVNLVQTHEE